MTDETQTDELVLVPLRRAGAAALWAAASVGLDTDQETVSDDVDLDAGWEANEALRKALDLKPEGEVAVVGQGIRALEALFSHDRELVVIDPGDGVGILSEGDYAALYGLLALLRDAHLIDSRTATVQYRGARATVELTDDPEPEFSESHLRVALTCDPPPRGYDSLVYSAPILVGDVGR